MNLDITAMQKQAAHLHLNRKILGYSRDETNKTFRVNVVVADKVREESDFFFIKSEFENEALIAAKALATANFLGNTQANYIDFSTIQNNNKKSELTQTQPKGETHDSSSVSGNKATSEEKSGSKKAGGKKSQQKEVVETTAKEASAESTTAQSSGEEMEAVESPFQEVKAIPYERTKEQQSILGNFLTKLHGNDSWKKMKGVTEFSQSLVGKPFLDHNGGIVDSFELLCREFLGCTL